MRAQESSSRRGNCYNIADCEDSWVAVQEKRVVSSALSLQTSHDDVVQELLHDSYYIIYWDRAQVLQANTNV